MYRTGRATLFIGEKRTVVLQFQRGQLYIYAGECRQCLFKQFTSVFMRDERRLQEIVSRGTSRGSASIWGWSQIARMNSLRYMANNLLIETAADDEDLVQDSPPERLSLKSFNEQFADTDPRIK